MSEKDLKNLKSMLASNAMEGFNENEQAEQDCIKVLSGEITFEELMMEMLTR